MLFSVAICILLKEVREYVQNYLELLIYVEEKIKIFDPLN